MTYDIYILTFVLVANKMVTRTVDLRSDTVMKSTEENTKRTQPI